MITEQDISQLNTEFATAGPEAILQWAAETLKPDVAASLFVSNTRRAAAAYDFTHRSESAHSLRGYRLPLSRNACLSRSAGRRVAAQPASSACRHAQARICTAIRRALPPGSRSMLLHQQSRAHAARHSRLARLDQRNSARRITGTRRYSDYRADTARSAAHTPLGQLDQARHLAVRSRASLAGASPAGSRLSKHRLRAVHAARVAGRRRALRPLVRL